MNYVTCKRVSQLTGKAHTMTLPLDRGMYLNGYSRWKNGLCIQDAFPTLSANERKFLMTGVTPEEWENTFGPSND